MNNLSLYKLSIMVTILLLLGSCCLGMPTPVIVHVPPPSITPLPGGQSPAMTQPGPVTLAQAPLASPTPISAIQALASATPTPWIEPRVEQAVMQWLDADSFTAMLAPGAWHQFNLGSSAIQAGYVVDISPLEPSRQGAHIEHMLLPEFDGETWHDVLSVRLSAAIEPLPVQVDVYSTSNWPIILTGELSLEPGVWHGFVIQPADEQTGYVLEITPQTPGLAGQAFQRIMFNPEFFMQQWQDVLRIQLAPFEPVMMVNINVYKTSDLPLAAEYILNLKPGDWQGYGLGASSQEAAYVVEVTPQIKRDNQVERYTVQPEFDGVQWNDVVRVMIPADRPAMDHVQVRVYRVSP